MRSSPRSATLAQVLTVVAIAIILAPVAHAGAKYKVLHAFGSGSDGAIPSGPLTLGEKGDLYGSTGAGGGLGCDGYGCGTIFQLTRQANGAWGERSLHDFADNGDSADPKGNLVLDTAGNLYGTLNGAGTGQGALFELSRGSSGWNLSLFWEHEEFSPGLLLNKAGDLYGFFGAGEYQAGAVGVLSRGSKGWNYALLYSFGGHGGGNGWDPEFPLSWDAQGNLYGTTLYGGNSYSSGHMKFCPDGSGCGVAFQMTPNSDGTWTYHVLHRFANYKNDGRNPGGGLVVDASGNAYGVTVYGGVDGNGTVFEFTPSSDGHWKQTVLYDFPNCADGCLPGNTIVFDKAGDLYGTANGGVADCGGYTCGVIFKLTPQTGGRWKYSVVHKFNGADGGFPYGAILDDKGNLYGTTQAFGKYNAGVAFEITP